MRRVSPQGSRRTRSILLALGLGIAALALAPAGASADVAPNTCVQTNSPAPGEPSTWTCWGPSASVSGYEVKRGYDRVPLPQGVDGYITRMQVDLVDQSEAPVPIDRLMLHHIVFMNLNRSDSACGGPERFYGAGEERARISFPDGYGYDFNQGDAWWTAWMYMNHRAQTDTAYVQYKLTIDPDPAIRPVRSYWLDVGDCQADPIYNVPGSELPTVQKCKKVGKGASRAAQRRAGKCRKKAKKQKRARDEIIAAKPTHTLSKDVRIKQDGFLIAGAGHTHGGASALTLTKPGCPGNPEVARSDPTWGNADHPFYNVKPILHEPGPMAMSAFGTEQGIPVKANQMIRLNSIYDNVQPHARVMGIFVVYFLKRDGGLGDPPIGECAGSPSDIQYGDGIPVEEQKTGRTEPVSFRVPLTGLDQVGNAIEIDGPPGPFRTLSSGATVTVGDRFFSEPNVIVRKGTTLSYLFTGNEPHNLTLANGPMGIGSPDATSGEVYNQTFTRSGIYRLFCGLHPVQMSERVVVKNSLKKKKKKRKK